MNQGLQIADQIIIIGYFALLTGIGLYFWKRMKQARDFFIGGNQIPWWLAGVSFYMTSFSAFMFIAYSEMAYRYGFVALTLAWASAVAMAAGTIFLAARWRRARIISPVEFLEIRYNKQIRQILAWAGIPLRVVDDALKIYATGVFVSVGLGFDLKTSIVVCGAVMLLYTFMGGLWAVVVTDYLQFIVLTLGVLALFPLVFARFDSPDAFINGLPAGFWSPASERISPLYVFAFYLLILVSYNGNWALAQKFYCVRDEREARKTGWLAAGLMALGPPLFLLPAMAARALLPELMTPPNSPQYTYAMLAVRFLPAGLMGLMIAAMFSATMSTLSGDYNVVASVITKDIYQRLFDKQASERRLVVVGRLATLLGGGLTVAIGVGLAASARRSLFEIMVTLFGIFVGPMLIPMLLGLLSRRVTWRSAAAGITAGFICGLSLFFYKTFALAKQPGIDPNWLRYDFEAITILINFAVTIAAIVLVARLEKARDDEQTEISAFFERLAKPIRADEMEEAKTGEAFSPFYLIGWVTIGTSLLLLGAAARQDSGTGRAINLGAGVALGLIGAGFFHLHRQFRRGARHRVNESTDLAMATERAKPGATT
jgi:solute:Na+ symporter, SSS family